MQRSNDERRGQAGSPMEEGRRHDILAGILGKLRIINRELGQHSTLTENLIGIKTTELMFLQYVCRHPGVQLREIARGLSVHQSTSSNVKRSLIEQLLVTEAPDPEDKRVTLLYATERGRDLVERALRDLSSPLRTATDEITADDLRLLDRILGSITDRIEGINLVEEEKLKKDRGKGKGDDRAKSES